MSESAMKQIEAHVRSLSSKARLDYVTLSTVRGITHFTVGQAPLLDLLQEAETVGWVESKSTTMNEVEGTLWFLTDAGVVGFQKLNHVLLGSGLELNRFPDDLVEVGPPDAWATDTGGNFSALPFDNRRLAETAFTPEQDKVRSETLSLHFRKPDSLTERPSGMDRDAQLSAFFGDARETYPKRPVTLKEKINLSTIYDALSSAAFLAFLTLMSFTIGNYRFEAWDMSRLVNLLGGHESWSAALSDRSFLLTTGLVLITTFAFVRALLRLAGPQKLVIDNSGFIVFRGLFKKHYNWFSVPAFSAGGGGLWSRVRGRAGHVHFNVQKKPIIGKIKTRSLPSRYGVSSESLADLLGFHRIDSLLHTQDFLNADDLALSEIVDGAPLDRFETQLNEFSYGTFPASRRIMFHTDGKVLTSSWQQTGYAPMNQKTTLTPKPTPSNDTWQSPHERDAFDVREERAPIGKYAVGLLALLLVGGGAVWLASKVVIAEDVPVIERAEKPPTEEQPQAPKSADDEAWVQALETDTVEGYRAYLAAFPNGRHVEDAIRLINEFDEKAWAIAQERDTIAGYEDYLAAWPEGLHATEARDRIAQIKAEEEARRKNAEEAARQEAAAWQAAAETNTIPSYEGYLSKFPAGKNAAEAQSRIDRLRATAADEAAWTVARTTNSADAYQQYLTSFPQGVYVPDAIAALENLRPSPGKTFKDCDACPTMVSLPTGTAELGADANDADAKPNEKPSRPVTFTSLFAIGVTEVTFNQYQACVSAGGCQSVPSDNGWGGGNRPVINVSWSDAVAYAQWLSNVTGKPYSLPSGAQWEYAARGGDTGKYPGGSVEAICAFANGASKESGLPWANEACTDTSADRTLPVGNLSKNKFGTQDMIGNVAEWVLDCNTLNLRDAPVDGSADARGSCSQRIVRGGSWFSGADGLRYAARAVQRRGDTNDFTGFRVVRN